MMFDTCTIVPALLHVLVLGLFAVFVTSKEEEIQYVHRANSGL